MADTSISWCDKVWNPVRGCARVSEGCKRCYAEQMAGRFSREGLPYHGLVTEIGSRSRNKYGPTWTGEARFIPEKLSEPLHWRKPKRIFVNSMSDLFHRDVTNEQIAAVFGVMAVCPQHRFMVLTKRPERMQEWFKWLESKFKSEPGKILECIGSAVRQVPLTREMPLEGISVEEWPLRNVYLGVSVENQDALHRIEKLRDTPAHVRFASFEPLLGPIRTSATHRMHLNWVIFGCESGSKRRPMEREWLESLVEQYGDYCARFVKQMQINGKVTDDPNRFPEHLRIQEFP